MRINLTCWISLFLLSLTSIVWGEWNLQWTRDLPVRKVAWEFTPKMSRDVGYEVLIHRGLVLVSNEYDCSLAAFDVKTGEERWRFSTSGPLRTAAIAAEERIVFGSEDGRVYCLDLEGKLLWSHRGGPSDRLALGHERLVSAWPVVVKPVIHEGRVYSIAGLWPVDGVFLQSLELTTGRVIWTNSHLQYRPTGVLQIVEGELVVDGHHGNGVYRLRDGQLLEKKPPAKQPLPEFPVTPAIGGQLTGKFMGEGAVVAVNTAGKMHVFTENERAPARHHPLPPRNETLPANAPKFAANIAAFQGYALVYGTDDVNLLAGMLRDKAQLHVMVVDTDRARLNKLRTAAAAAGLFLEHRLDVVEISDSANIIPPYFANWVIIASKPSDQLREQLHFAVRPYGGGLLEFPEQGHVHVLKREGKLPDSDDWTHEMHDAGNTLASRDKLVKAPLGILWYGGIAADPKYYFDGNLDHQSGDGLNPQPVPAQIVDGRMLLQAPGLMAAFDLYNGRLLWESPLPRFYTFGGKGGGLGIHSKNHPQPWKFEGALKYELQPTQHCRASGFDFATADDGIYLAAGPKMLRLNPEDGKEVSSWTVPIDEPELCWGSVRQVGSLLLATAFRPQDLADAQAGFDGNGGEYGGDRMPMAYLLAVDRQSGKLVWKRSATSSFLNRGIAIGNGRVYCVDLLLRETMSKWKEAGRKLPTAKPTILGLDLATGRELWKYETDVLVKNLVYAPQRDLILAANRNLTTWEDGQWTEKPAKAYRNLPGKMRGITGATGKVAWEVDEAPYFDPHVILDDLIIDRDGVTYRLTDGKRHERKSPITGEDEVWSFKKGGCNHLICCDNLVTWRTAYYDLAEHRGTLSLKGLDAGCCPTLIPAGGVLAIPNFGTHHKRNRMTAMALVHLPENQLWTKYDITPSALPTDVQKLGYNFGALGDRRDANGVMWLSVAKQNSVNAMLNPKSPGWFMQSAPGLPAVATTGAVGLSDVSLPTTVGGKAKATTTRKFDVRLIFAEPDQSAKIGSRVFNVTMEGSVVLKEFDIVREIGPGKMIVKEFNDVTVSGPLDLKFEPLAGESVICGVELRAK